MRAFSNYKQTIKVKVRQSNGVDSFNCPTYTWTEYSVDNCLCVPFEPVDLPLGQKGGLRPEARYSKLHLYLPVECQIDFTYARVYAYGRWYETLGIPTKIYKKNTKIPTEYDRYVILKKEIG